MVDQDLSRHSQDEKLTLERLREVPPIFDGMKEAGEPVIEHTSTAGKAA